jgi:hypothetical protein
MRDPLVLVDQGREDVGALGTSLRMEGVDMRLPAGFQRVYRVPGRDDLLMRGNGALFAIFPESVYRATRNGRVAVAPPGTVYSIGMPGALHTQPIAPPQPTFAPGQFDGRVDGAMHARVDGSASRVDARVVLMDERMSTTEAQRRQREGGSTAELDSLAACVILEAWLRTQQEAA